MASTFRQKIFPMDLLQFFWIGICLHCSIPEVFCETQKFREIPQNALVSEGDEIQLRCAVDYQRGKAQWTKDGFALGFERDVPGYPRYQYNGDQALGEHHLIITGVTLQDDGEYQCQVGPTNDAPPIWAAANVTVLVAPGSISIVGYNDGAVVEVISGTSLSLECLVADARPAPTLTWYRDGIELNLSRQRDETEPGSRPRLMSIRSRLLIQAVPADDKQQFSCRGHHPALARLPAALVASITLSVLHPPKPPVIFGFKKEEILLSGQRMDLTCKSQGGNPKPWVLWYRDGTLIDDSTTTDGNEVVNVLNLEVTSEVDEATLECRVTSDMLEEPYSDAVRLKVQYSPTSLTIRGPKSIAIGDELRLNCETSPSNPKSDVRWFIQDKEIKSVTSSTVKNPTGGWITRSQIEGYRVTADKSQEGSQIKAICQAENSVLNEVISETHAIALVKPAGPPFLEGLGGETIAGRELSFSCRSEGGNPPPTMTLYKGGELLTSEVAMEGQTTEVITRFKTSPEDNGQEVTCQVNHPATEEPRTVTQRLTILFPPIRIVGRASPSAVEEGHHVTLSCESSSSNPPANITWYSGGSLLSGASQHLTQGEYRSKGTRSELVVRTQAEDDGRIFSCEGSNGLFPVASTNITISVSHAPVWVIRPPDQVDVYEGEDFVMSATAAANPGPLRYWWRRGDNNIPSSGGELHIPKINRGQSGNYSISAYSPRGGLNATFSVNVQYPPEKVTTAERITLNEGDETTVECSARGNPAPDIVWTLSNRSEQLSRGQQLAHLSVKNARREDTGIYICTASNGVGIPASMETKVIVRHGPLILREEIDNQESWAEIGGKGVLLCHAKGAPVPSFHWAIFSGRTLESGSKFTIKESILVDDLTTWMSVLEIKDVQQNDYSDYRCTTNNNLGADTAVITLRQPDKPHPPKDLRVVNATSSTVTLTWAKSHLGGGPVHAYVVRYKEQGMPNFEEVETSSDNSLATVYNLKGGRTYIFTVYATNNKGNSPLIDPAVVVSVPDELPNIIGQSSSVSSSDSRGNNDYIKNQWRVPRLVILITSLTGATLLILNIVMISCFVRRRNARNISASSSKTATFGSIGVATTDTNSTLGSRSSCETVQKHGSCSPHHISTKSTPNDQDSKSIENSPTSAGLTPGNGHLGQNYSHSPSLTPARRFHPENVVQANPLESSRSVDLLKGSMSPEGRRAAAVNPEVCSLASSTYEHPIRKTSGAMLVEEDKPCPMEDQLSIGSCHSNQSRSFGYVPGKVVTPVHLSQDKLYTPKNSIPPTKPYKEPGTNKGIIKLPADISNQYASLNAAKLCDLKTGFYDTRCCSGQDPGACPCHLPSDNIFGYATLGTRTRKVKFPQFSTLQRNKPSEYEMNPCHAESNGQTIRSYESFPSCNCNDQLPCSKGDTCISHEPCSLPECLSSLPIHQRRSSFHGAAYPAGLCESSIKNEVKIDLLEMTRGKDQGLHGRKVLTSSFAKNKENTRQSYNSPSEKPFNTTKLRMNSPNTIRKKEHSQSSQDSLPESQIHRANSAFNSYSNDFAVPYTTRRDANDICDTSSSSSSTTQTLPLMKPRFPYDYIQQTNGQCKLNSAGDAPQRLKLQEESLKFDEWKVNNR